MVITLKEFTGPSVKKALGAKSASKFYSGSGTFGMKVEMPNGKEYRFDVFYSPGKKTVNAVIFGAMWQRYAEILSKGNAANATFNGLMNKAKNYMPR